MATAQTRVLPLRTVRLAAACSLLLIVVISILPR
jgi:hypothetical protein